MSSIINMVFIVCRRILQADERAKGYAVIIIS